MHWSNSRLDVRVLGADARNFMQFLDVYKAQSDRNIHSKSDSGLYAQSYGYPFESIAPAPLSSFGNYYYNAPYCVYPPFNPQAPFTAPTNVPNTPAGMAPSPPVFSPGPNPPIYVPGPPTSIPISPFSGSSPPVYLPPVVFPPPSGQTPPHKGSRSAVWCVAKPTVPDPIIQVAMDYACASGADCKLIQPNGPCFQPNSLLSHASVAFNSYFQNSKTAGGTCDFGGTAMLVTVDPSKFSILFYFSFPFSFLS